MMKTESNSYMMVEGHVIRVLNASQLSKACNIPLFEQAIRTLAATYGDGIEIDFRPSQALSSTIISLSLLALKLVEPYDCPLSVTTPMRYHRTLVSSGMINYVDLRCCG